MTKQVHKPEMVAHLWANQSQDSARVAHGNFYFNGPALYSYGSHYVAGYIMPPMYERDDRTLVLLNSYHYGATTSKHQHAARGAAQHHSRLYVDRIKQDDVYCIGRNGAHLVTAYVIAELKLAADKANKPRILERTRGAALEFAESRRLDALHLATVDASRRDIPAMYRELARRRVRLLTKPAAAYAPDGATTKEIAAAYAYALNRADWIASGKEAAERADRYGRAVLLGNDAGLDAREVLASLRHFDNAMDQVCAMAKLARSRLVTRNLADLKKEIEPHRAGIIERARVARLAVARSDWADWLMGAREILAKDERPHLNFHYAERLVEAFIGEPEHAENVAILSDLKASETAARTADNATRAATLYADARAAFAAGDYRLAYSAAGTAQRLLANPNVTPDYWDDLCTLRDDAAERIIEQHAVEVQAWRDGGALPPRDAMPDGVMLRLSRDGQRVETSHGAEVPARVAPLLWRMVTGARRTGDAWSRFGDGVEPVRLGHFLLDEVTPTGDIVAGCHRILYAELARLAATLGYDMGENA